MPSLMKLSKAFPRFEISQDVPFERLGRVDSAAAGTLAFADAASYVAQAEQNPSVVALVTTREMMRDHKFSKPAVIAENPRAAFYGLQNRLISEGDSLFPLLKKQWHASARVHPSAVVAEATVLEAGVVIHERATVLPNTIVRVGAEIHPGAVVGADGILYFQDGEFLVAVRHGGGVEIGERCSILANAVIARGIAADASTKVGAGTIVGIASTVGHEAILGRRCVVSGNSVVARLAHIGDDAWLGTGCVIREHVRVGAKARVAAGSVVVDSVSDGGNVAGNFAFNQADFLRHYLRLRSGKI